MRCGARHPLPNPPPQSGKGDKSRLRYESLRDFVTPFVASSLRRFVAPLSVPQSLSPCHFLTINVLFCPPKPKELAKHVSTLAGRPWLAT